MIDWHSHILPGMDDGSRSATESVEMLRTLREQGVDTVIATPHFHADHESVESFLERRAHSYEMLCKEKKDAAVRILLGAEVRYYQGISRLSSLEDIKTEGTKLLLLEMPEIRWSESVVKEIEEISCSSQTRLILAHVERCLPLQRPDVWYRLIDCGVLMQSNAEFFCDVLTKRKALRLLGEGMISLVGSDCHGLERRPPLLDRAYETIKKRFGEDFVLQMQEYGYFVLDPNR